MLLVLLIIVPTFYLRNFLWIILYSISLFSGYQRFNNIFQYIKPAKPYYRVCVYITMTQGVFREQFDRRGKYVKKEELLVQMWIIFKISGHFYNLGGVKEFLAGAGGFFGEILLPSLIPKK